MSCARLVRHWSPLLVCKLLPLVPSYDGFGDMIELSYNLGIDYVQMLGRYCPVV